MTARPCHNPACRAEVTGPARRLYCDQACQQRHRNALRSKDTLLTDRPCARPGCVVTFRQRTTVQVYCSPVCREGAAVARRPAPTTPRSALVRQLSEEAEVTLTRILAILADGPRSTVDLAAMLGRGNQAIARVLHAASTRGQVGRSGGQWHLATVAPTVPGRPGAITVEDHPARGVIVVTLPRSATGPGRQIILNRHVPPERVRQAVRRLEAERAGVSP